MRHLFSIAELEKRDLNSLVNRSAELFDPTASKLTTRLSRRVVGIYFERVSTRTRASFAAAASLLGANFLVLNSQDIQISTGETHSDTGMVLSLYLAVLIVRTYSNTIIREIASRSRIPIINALTEEEHPTQAIADLATIKQEFGAIEGLRILFVGEGHNIATSFILGLAHYPGLIICIASPKGFGLKPEVSRLAQKYASAAGSQVNEFSTLSDVSEQFDVIYTTRWESMGQTKPESDWRTSFEPFRVDLDLIHRLASSRAIFLHDLPAATGSEVAANVLDSGYSRVLRQAQNKLSSAIASLEWCTADDDT